MALVVDYSWARPTVGQLLDLGCTGVMRYLSHEPAKNLSITERNRLWAAGIPIGLIWESTARRPLAGYDAGVADAHEAQRQARRLGWPTHVPIAFGVDFDPVGQLAPIASYFRGVLSSFDYPTGDYGAFSVVEMLAGLVHNGRRVVCHWQCAGWSGRATAGVPEVRLDNGERRRRSRHSCMVQDLEGSRLAGTDVNHVFGPVDFLYHPDQPRTGAHNRMELPTMKRLAWNSAEHLVTTDETGLPRRYIIPPGSFASLFDAAGITDGAVALSPEQGAALMALPEAGPNHGALALTGHIIGQITAEIRTAAAAVLAAVAAGGAAGPSLPDDFDDQVESLAADVVARIEPKLAAIVSAAVDEELDGIAD